MTTRQPRPACALALAGLSLFLAGCTAESAAPELAKGESFERRFDAVGTFAYFCEPHPGMRGVVEVVPSGNASATRVVEARIASFAFEPPALTVPVGSTVRWTNLDRAVHTVTFEDQRSGRR